MPGVLMKLHYKPIPDAYPTFNNIWGTITNKNAALIQHNIEVSSGAERVKYHAALGYQYQEGMWPAGRPDQAVFVALVMGSEPR